MCIAGSFGIDIGQALGGAPAEFFSSNLGLEGAGGSRVGLDSGLDPEGALCE